MERLKRPYSLHTRPTTSNPNRPMYYAVFRDEARRYRPCRRTRVGPGWRACARGGLRSRSAALLRGATVDALLAGAV